MIVFTPWMSEIRSERRIANVPFELMDNEELIDIEQSSTLFLRNKPRCQQLMSGGSDRSRKIQGALVRAVMCAERGPGATATHLAARFNHHAYLRAIVSFGLVVPEAFLALFRKKPTNLVRKVTLRWE
jgi:hypothetical protein